MLSQNGEKGPTGYTVFEVNEFIMLKLIGPHTVIFVAEERFLHCKFLLLDISVNKISSFDEIESIDESQIVEITWTPPLFRSNQPPYPPAAERTGDPMVFSIENETVSYTEAGASVQMQLTIKSGDYEICLSVVDLDGRESVDSPGILRRVVSLDSPESVLNFEIRIIR